MSVLLHSSSESWQIGSGKWAWKETHKSKYKILRHFVPNPWRRSGRNNQRNKVQTSATNPPLSPSVPRDQWAISWCNLEKKTELVFALTMSSQILHVPSGKITKSEVQTHLRVRGKAPLQGKISVATSRPESRPRESRRRRRRRRSSGVQAAGWRRHDISGSSASHA